MNKRDEGKGQPPPVDFLTLGAPQETWDKKWDKTKGPKLSNKIIEQKIDIIRVTLRTNGKNIKPELGKLRN